MWSQYAALITDGRDSFNTRLYRDPSLVAKRRWKNSANIDRWRSDSFDTLVRQQIAVMPATTLADSPSFQGLARPFRWSIFAYGIRLRERQSFPAFLRKRRNLVEAARSTMDPCEWFSNQCTTAPLSKSFCTLAVVWLPRQLIPVGNVVSNSGMYTKLLFYLAKNSAENCTLPFFNSSAISTNYLVTMPYPNIYKRLTFIRPI